MQEYAPYPVNNYNASWAEKLIDRVFKLSVT